MSFEFWEHTSILILVSFKNTMSIFRGKCFVFINCFRIFSLSLESRNFPRICVGERKLFFLYFSVFLSVVVVPLFSRVWLFVTPWTAALQASLSFTVSQSLLKLISIELVMPSNHFIFCHSLLLLLLSCLRPL